MPGSQIKMHFNNSIQLGVIHLFRVDIAVPVGQQCNVIKIDYPI